jgi:DUF1009 family protein
MMKLFLNFKTAFFSQANNQSRNFMVVGAHGKLGNQIVASLSGTHGENKVIAVDTMSDGQMDFSCDYAQVNPMMADELSRVVQESGCKVIVHNGVRCTMARPSDVDIQQLMKQNIETT